METIKYIKLVTLILIGLSLNACATETQNKDIFTLHDDYGTYTQSQIDIIQSAMDDWCTASEGQFCAEIGEGSSRIYLSTLENMPKVKGHANTIGVQWSYDHGSSTIYFVNTLQNNDLKLVALHELGHHFGCMKHFTNDSFMQLTPLNSSNDIISNEILDCAQNKINELY